MRFRTVLFTPGNRVDRIEKAWVGSAADIVVADLEDAVGPAGKVAARGAVGSLLERVERGAGATCLRAVRINGGAAGLEDIRHLPAPDMWVVPKADDVGMLHAVAAATPEVPILAILETPLGIIRAHEIACVPRVAGLAFGAEDLASASGMRRSASNAEVAVPRALVALAAAAAEISAVDMITPDLKDLDRFRREAREARALGYAGKMCLHPKQVDAVHEAFRPTAVEVAWARKVVAADNGGVSVVDGTMIDGPLVRLARQMLDDAST